MILNALIYFAALTVLLFMGWIPLAGVATFAAGVPILALIISIVVAACWGLLSVLGAIRVVDWLAK